ncbi:MAG: bifunctional ADP-heptose synthase [Anaerolineae bacterium]
MDARRDDLLALIPRLAAVRLAVLGDVFLDEYLVGRVERVSREAPIPVLEFQRRFTLAGGSANPAHTAVSLGARVSLVGLVGADAAAAELRERLTVSGIGDGLVEDGERCTTVKTRVMAEGTLVFPQQVARLDRLSRLPAAGDVEAALVRGIEALIPAVDAVLVSDYKTGVVTERVIEACRVAAHTHGKLLAVDSQGDLPKFRGFDLIRAGARDAAASLGRPLDSDADFEAATRGLVASLGARVVTIGRAEAGLSVGWNGAYAHLPAINKTEVYDVTGAGDTQAATLTLALAARATPLQAAILGNYAAGLVIRKLGNAVPTPDELAWAIEHW